MEDEKKQRERRGTLERTMTAAAFAFGFEQDFNANLGTNAPNPLQGEAVANFLKTRFSRRTKNTLGFDNLAEQKPNFSLTALVESHKMVTEQADLVRAHLGDKFDEVKQVIEELMLRCFPKEVIEGNHLDPKEFLELFTDSNREKKALEDVFEGQDEAMCTFVQGAYDHVNTAQNRAQANQDFAGQRVPENVEEKMIELGLLTREAVQSTRDVLQKTRFEEGMKNNTANDMTKLYLEELNLAGTPEQAMGIWNRFWEAVQKFSGDQNNQVYGELVRKKLDATGHNVDGTPVNARTTKLMRLAQLKAIHIYGMQVRSYSEKTVPLDADVKKFIGKGLTRFDIGKKKVEKRLLADMESAKDYRKSLKVTEAVINKSTEVLQDLCDKANMDSKRIKFDVTRTVFDYEATQDLVDKANQTSGIEPE